MKRPILDPKYWRDRLQNAGQLHHAIFICPLERWNAIAAKHKKILADEIHPSDRVLDAGCGWGRLLELLPEHALYSGVDLSPDFISMARSNYPNYDFSVGDLRELPFADASFDWAIMVSIRPMVMRELGVAEWANMEGELRRVAKQLLFLEYDPANGGSIE